MRIPSFGLVEIIILSIVAGLVLLAGAVVTVIVVKKRKESGTQGAGLHEPEASTQRSRAPWIWIALLILVVVLVLPLCAVVGGVLLVTPVRREMAPAEQEMGAAVIVAETVTAPATTPLQDTTASGATPTRTPWLTPTRGVTSPTTSQPPSASAGASGLLSLDPFNPTALVILLGFAGLVVLLGVAAVVAVGKGRALPTGDVALNGDDQDVWGRTAKLRYILLALAFWVALSVFLVLDLVFSVSLYWQFVVMYAAFWVLVGALLASGRPVRDKLLILGLFAIVLVSIRFVDWNSRKPFLRDLNRIEEGMTVAQVDQIMGGYIKEHGGGPPRSETQYEFDEQGGVVTGWVTYRHTNEGWGDSDWGVVAFENGQVVKTEFLPD